MEPEVASNAGNKRPAGAGIRLALALGIILAISAYIVGIVIGKIQDKQKLGIADVGLLLVGCAAVAVLLRPELLERVTHIKVGSVEFELQKLQHDQEKQRNELDDVRFVLTLLLEPSELQHLKNIDKGKTQDYLGRHSVRTELRKLRTLGLIRNRDDRKISELADNSKMDLKNIVELTERGRQYLARLAEYSAEE